MDLEIMSNNSRGPDVTGSPSHYLNVSLCSQPDDELIPSYFGIMLALPEWESILAAIILSVIIVLTIVGNLLVILGVFTSKALRIVQNFYIVSLAVADLTVALFVLPFSLIYLILGRWEFGIHLCKIWLTSDVMCCTSSILSLCVIALDRYWAITDPVKNAHRRTMSRVLSQIVGVWVLSFLISSPPLLGWNDWPEIFTNASPCQLSADPGYVIFSSMGSFFIPLMVMTIVYIKIFVAIRKRLRDRSRMSTKFPPVSTSTPEGTPKRSLAVCCQRRCSTESVSSIELDEQIARTGRTRSMKSDANEQKPTLERSLSDVQKFMEQKQKVALSKERRAARTLGVIMGVFVFCWLPFFLMYIILPFCDSCCPSNRFKYFITWLGYINSGLNPVIYTIFNKDYRKAFKRLLGLS